MGCKRGPSKERQKNKGCDKEDVELPKDAIKYEKLSETIMVLKLKTNSSDTHTREGQKVLATIFFLFTWVHLYKGGSVYIKYKPLSFMPCNMDSVTCLVALRH